MPKKVMAILATDTMTEFYRCYGPYKRLSYSWHDSVKNPRLVLSDNKGVLTLHRTFFPNIREEYAAGTVEAIKNFQRAGYQVVAEFDDDFTAIPIYNRGYWANSPQTTEAMKAVCRTADAVLVSTQHLAERMLKYNPRSSYIENCIDPAMWPKHPVSGVGIMGSTSHILDWKHVPEIWDRVHKVLPDEVLRVVGYDHPWFAFEHILNRGPWRQVPDMLDFAIGLAPLEDNLLNRSKSNCKFLEYTMAGAVTVAQNCPPYADTIQHGVTGFLADTPYDFANYVIMLSKDEKLREKIAVSARTFVLRNYNIDVNYTKWRTFYERL